MIARLLAGPVNDNTTAAKYDLVQLECSDPESDDILAWSDTTLWAFALLYLFLGLYIICEHYFVPSLERIGDGMGLSEGVQGATLMAGGTSFPELCTAVVGVVFFPDENPGA